MTDLLDFISELKELQVLYNEGEIRNFDFDTKIQKYENQFTDFEDAMQAQQEMFPENC
jgi:hypothetical protein